MLTLTDRRSPASSTMTASAIRVNCFLLVLGLNVLYLVACNRAAAQPDVEELMRWLENEDPSVRYMAVEALGNFEGELRDGLPSLFGACEDESDDVRIGAVYAIANLGPRAAGAVPVLVKALRDKNTEVRAGAAYALPTLGAEATRALPSLRKSLADKSRQVRREAASSIAKLKLIANYQEN